MENKIIKKSVALILLLFLTLTVVFSGCSEKDIAENANLDEAVASIDSENTDTAEISSEEDAVSQNTETSSKKSQANNSVASKTQSKSNATSKTQSTVVTSQIQSKSNTTSKTQSTAVTSQIQSKNNTTSKTQSVKSETKSQNSSATQTESQKVTSTAPTYTDFFVCEYTIYLKREYADKQYTASDFTNLPVKKLEENKLIYHLFADYTKKEEVLASFKSIMSRKEVDNVFCEYSSYRVLEGETEPKLPSLERQVFGEVQERNLYYDGAISTTLSSEDFTVWSVADFPELSLEAIEGSIYSKDCNSSWLVMYLATLGDEARINAAEKMKARKDVVSVSEKYSPFAYED